MCPRYISPLGWILLALGLVSAVAQAQQYRYVPFDDKIPAGFTDFVPGGINDSGQVAGYVEYCDDDGSCFDQHVAVYQNGVITVLQPGSGSLINAAGTIGGYVVLDPDPFNFLLQAALFRGNKVELIPPQPGEFFAFVIGLNDRGAALVLSITSFDDTYVLYENGESTVLDFGPDVTRPLFLGSKGHINNNGIVAGTTTTVNLFDGARGFRFDTRTGEALLLEPVFPDTLAWGLGINTRGDVLGYSFVSEAPYRERIGVWDHKGNFKTYVDRTFSSNNLLFNDNNLIVIRERTTKTSYLVPKPGVQLNLADLVENLPPGQDLSSIFDINNHGDMLGAGVFGVQGAFLLERIGGRRR